MLIYCLLDNHHFPKANHAAKKNIDLKSLTREQKTGVKQNTLYRMYTLALFLVYNEVQENRLEIREDLKQIF